MTLEELKPHLLDDRKRWRTSNLFLETCDDPAKYPPIYTFGDSDTSSQVSFRNLYLAFEDTTEYKVATFLLGGWDHWQAITQSFRVKPYVEVLRRDLELMLRNKYIERIADLASSTEGPMALQASKYLLEMTTKLAGQRYSPKRGRPSSLEKEEALKLEIKEADELREDLLRMDKKALTGKYAVN